MNTPSLAGGGGLHEHSFLGRGGGGGGAYEHSFLGRWGGGGGMKTPSLGAVGTS